MGRLVPSLITLENTAPIPTGDASQANSSGRLGSWLELALKLLTLCGMLRRTALSISNCDSSPRVDSGDALPLIG